MNKRPAHMTEIIMAGHRKRDSPAVLRVQGHEGHCMEWPVLKLNQLTYMQALERWQHRCDIHAVSSSR